MQERSTPFRTNVFISTVNKCLSCTPQIGSDSFVAYLWNEWERAVLRRAPVKYHTSSNGAEATINPITSCESSIPRTFLGPYTPMLSGAPGAYARIISCLRDTANGKGLKVAFSQWQKQLLRDLTELDACNMVVLMADIITQILPMFVCYCRCAPAKCEISHCSY